MSDLFSKLSITINEKTIEIASELKDKINEIKEEFASTIGKLQHRIQELEIQNKNLQQRVIQTERKVRKNNLILFGIHTEEENLVDLVISVFNDILELHISTNDLNSVYKLEKQGTKDCPIIVEFISYETKLLVLKNSKKLKGKQIYISRDQCKEDREKYKILIQHQKKARGKGKVAYIRREKLFINNAPYTIAQLEKQEALEAEDDKVSVKTKVQKKELLQKEDTHNRTHKILRKETDALDGKKFQHKRKGISTQIGKDFEITKQITNKNNNKKEKKNCNKITIF